METMSKRRTPDIVSLPFAIAGTGIALSDLPYGATGFEAAFGIDGLLAGMVNYDD